MKSHKFSVPLKTQTSTHKSTNHAAVPTSFAQQQRAVNSAIRRACHVTPRKAK